MIASEIIGLAALLLVLIFFYTRFLFPRLRSVLILILAFASAGLVGYSSASSIGIGWTISLALLIFMGVAISVFFLQKREDRKIEQHFELALKSEHPPMVKPAEEAIPAPLLLPAEEERERSHETTASVEEAPAAHLDAPHTAVFAASEEVDHIDVPPLPAEQPEIQMMERIGIEEVYCEDNFEGVTPLAIVSDEKFAATEEVLLELGVEQEHTDPESLSEPVLSAIGHHDPPVQNDPVLEQVEEIGSGELHTEIPAPKSESTILSEDRTRIQALSAKAEVALQQGDYLRAYQALREALAYSPPVMATYILSRQLVQVLNEMGLYEESISVMEKVLNESPTLSSKKREEFIRHVSYLEELIQQLQLENKRNLSWSLVPPAIHKKTSIEAFSLRSDRVLAECFRALRNS